jgi:hypothetical protein
MSIPPDNGYARRVLQSEIEDLRRVVADLLRRIEVMERDRPHLNPVSEHVED